MKPGRQSVILKIISEQNIETQYELLEALRERGISSTQATLSRDIRDLRLTKEPGADGRSRYVVSQEADNDDNSGRLQRIFRDGVVSADRAENFIVLKTLPGLASACCSALDGMRIENLLGTIAGDDTAFLLMRTADSAEEFLEEIEKLL